MMKDLCLIVNVSTCICIKSSALLHTSYMYKKIVMEMRFTREARNGELCHIN